MSEMAPERPAPPGRRENVFTRRIGPLPMWVWLVIVGGGILAWSLYKSRTAGSTTSSGASTGTDASQVPQFVNQTYVSTTPPVAGPPGPPGRPGPPGPPGRGGHPGVIPGEPPPGRGGTLQPGGPVVLVPGRGGSSGQGTRTERLKHKGNLLQIASRNHIDLEDLLEANPELKRYQGTGHQFPVGTTIRIPPQAA